MCQDEIAINPHLSTKIIDNAWTDHHHGIMADGMRFPMKAVVKRTGLTSHVIRVWERRYGAVAPSRSPKNRRLYSEAEVNRLQLLKRVVDAGHSISQAAALTAGQLQSLAGGLSPAAVQEERTLDPARGSEHYCGEALNAVRALDSEGLLRVLREAALYLPRPALLDQVILPLIRSLGEGWQLGVLRVSHEHMASAVIRAFLGELLHSVRCHAAAPGVLFATPAGQVHELGIFTAAVVAASQGWRVHYLGTDVPAEDLAAAARQVKVRALVLSLVYPPEDPGVSSELVKLREYLPAGMPIIVGGRAVESYRNVLDAIGAVCVSDMPGFSRELQSLPGVHSL
jgi:MerR family transcriptional regulator, light-induced transcriptional regulator